ncbi:hypothetical protein WJX73_005932 [Symbiochloris irregularis]|uniref:isoleucine--tRNA ligase n=1 Tax=Symbiochloris irregularis TaxID=706552 RepID=A0AAW1NNA1_9CHLO
MQEVRESKDLSFPGEEKRILTFWEEIDAFKQQLKQREGAKPYSFYDGPPFATGLPHYGHLLAGTIKDIVTRFASATGHYVPRRFGWDCHGLPVEYEIDKAEGIKSREDVLKMGIDTYNEKCRSIVMRYSKEWESTVRRMGRWIDFESGYRTMDATFMESVWWVFKQLHDKGLVYRGFKVMPYSTGCKTPLSNFEAGQNYKDVMDPAIMVSFSVEDDAEKAELVAWTTTPWTLPSNLALCVNPAMEYVRVQDPATGRVYIVAEARLAFLPGAVPKAKKGGKKDAAPAAGFKVLSKMKGSALVGMRYTPLFPFFAHLKAPRPSDSAPSANGGASPAAGAFRVVSDNYVTSDSGTGVVHQAPAFGEDDMRVCIAHGILQRGESIPCPVDADGCFTEEVATFSGRYVKEADSDIIAWLKQQGRLVSNERFSHSYPFCWRSDTPLIYKAVPSWFVKVENARQRLLATTAQTEWVPSFVRDKRFGNWLEGAHDWAVSRSRFWGTPLPVWTSADGKEVVVVGSVEELHKLTGHKVTDLHRHFIDGLTIPSPSRGEPLRRVDEVFDCWFESGSMPYAQLHYPFENVDFFRSSFPADFVAEGLDQTRGWFYTLIVLSTLLFDQPAFKNLVCNGLVLAADGKKMSKRLKNYPDPAEIIEEYGADALRLYLINSPVVRAESLRFRREGVQGVVREVFIPWYNAFRFLVQNVLRLEASGRLPTHMLPFNPAQVEAGPSANVLDRWIQAATRSLAAFVRTEMSAYRLYTVVPRLVQFLENLTNVYVRLNRTRLRGQGNDPMDCHTALATLFHVLLDTCKVMAPFTPFICELMYQNLRRALPKAPQSVHWCDFPETGPLQEGDEGIQASVEGMQRVLDLARVLRERHSKPLKQPLRRLTIVHSDKALLADLAGQLRQYVMGEVNVVEMDTCSDPLRYCNIKAHPEWQVLGKRLGKAMVPVGKAIQGMTFAQIEEFNQKGHISLGEHQLQEGDIKVFTEFKGPEGGGEGPTTMDANGDGSMLVVMDLSEDESLLEAFWAREVVNRIQKIRKAAGLQEGDKVDFWVTALREGEAPELERRLQTQREIFEHALGLVPYMQRQAHAVLVGTEVLRDSHEVAVTVPALHLRPAALHKVAGKDAPAVEAWLTSREPSALARELHAGQGSVSVALLTEQNARKSFTLQEGVHLHVPPSLQALASHAPLANGSRH